MLLSVHLTAFDSVTASKIFTKIFFAIFDKSPIVVYTPNPQYRHVITLAPSLQLADTHQSADILLADGFDEIPSESDTILFTTNAAVFRSHEQAVGAFYWEHGRPKIIFLQSRLELRHISLHRQFHKYIVRELP